MTDPRKLTFETVVRDDYDREDIARMRGEIHGLDVALEKLEGIAPTAPTLLNDLIASFLKAAPRQPAREEVRPTHLVNYEVMRETMDLPVWQSLRQATAGDEIATAMATMSMEPDVETLYDRLAKAQEHADRLQAEREALADAQAEAASLEEQLAALGEPRDDDSDLAEQIAALKERADEVDSRATELAEQTAVTEQRLEAEINRATPEIRRSMNNAVGKAAEEAHDLERSARSWGVERGELVRMNAKERFDLAKKLNTPKMKRLSDMIGAFRLHLEQEQERRRNDVPHEIVDVTKGDSLENMLPDELLRLTDTDFENEFYKDYLERNLSQYRLEGTERVGKGGLVVCTDSSDSMRGTPHNFAVATAMALLHFARKEKREFRWIHFGSSHEIEEFDFTDPESFSMDRLIAAAEFFFAGGTDFQTPLGIALNHLQHENDRTGAVRADIVFITDGHCNVSQTWLEEFKAEQTRLKFAVWGVAIGVSPTSEPLHTIADGKVVAIHDLATSDDVALVFRGV